MVSPDILGPVRNGGIGTACTSLARFLKHSGCDVTILFSQVGYDPDRSADWISAYSSHGINVVIAMREEYSWDTPTFPDHPALRMSHFVYYWLKVRSYDAVFFMEWQGHGFYAMNAKAAGQAFEKTTFVVQTHSPSLWHDIHNADLSSSPLQAITYFIERKSVELADVVVSPSRYMLNWMRQHGYRLPPACHVLPNLINRKLEKSRAIRQNGLIEEIVFFGRLEHRKGLIQFCDAIDILADLGQTPSTITFLGKFSSLGGVHSGVYIAERSVKWKCRVEFLTELDQNDAVEYLRSGSRLAVMPSVSDNSPYTVYECLTAKVPFLARDVGGVSELVNAADRDAALFNDNPRDLAAQIIRALSERSEAPRLSFSLDRNEELWISELQFIRSKRTPGIKTRLPLHDQFPLVSVCLVHYNRPQYLMQAVESLIRQDYPNFEVILVDDGSTSAEAQEALFTLKPLFVERGWKIRQQTNSYLGKARNNAAGVAAGQYLLFMDDDNVAKPQMLSYFVNAALSSNADVVTAAFDVFSGDSPPNATDVAIERFLPLGDIVSFSIFSNAIGDANSLVRRSTFAEIGGFSEDYGVGHEDFELYLRAVLSGAKFVVCPEPLFYYRRNQVSMLSTTNRRANMMRSFRPFLEHLPAGVGELAVLTFSAHPSLSQQQSEKSVDLPYQLTSADPNSSQAAVELVMHLLSLKQPEIARRFLQRRVQSAGDGSNVLHDLLSIVCAITDPPGFTDKNAVENMFGTLSEWMATDGAMGVRLYSTLVQIGNEPILSKLISADFVKLVASTCNASVGRNLEVSAALVGRSFLNLALPFVVRAVEEAELIYLRARADVQEAIRTGVFESALHHFSLHGRLERASDWPDYRRFAALASKIARQTAQIRSASTPNDAEFLVRLLKSFGAGA
ncbi:glycosyltransferase [Achromobacter sp. GG226]|nr:glycosyltransferase [Verticiella sp. GG226]